MDSHQCRIQEDAMGRVDFICGCNNGDEGNDDDTANTFSSCINIETEVTGTVSSIVIACDTDVSHQNRIDDLDLAKAFIGLNSRKVSYFGKTL